MLVLVWVLGACVWGEFECFSSCDTSNAADNKKARGENISCFHFDFVYFEFQQISFLV